MTKLPEDDSPTEDLISERLRQTAIVQGALQRLANQSKAETGDIHAVALDATLPFELRRDGVIIALAMADPNPELLRNLLHSNEGSTVIETLKLIKYLGTEWALPELLAGVKVNDDPLRRSLFAWALAAYPRNPEAEQVLLEVMFSDTTGAVRDHAIESLSEFRSPRVVEALLKALASGSASERFWALFSLGNLAEPKAREAISRCLQDQTVIPGYGTIADEAGAALNKIKHGGPWL